MRLNLSTREKMSPSRSCVSMLRSESYVMDINVFGTKYSLEGNLVLGEGASGCTRVCVDGSTGERLACKLIPKFKDSQDNIKGIAMELAILQALNSSTDMDSIAALKAISESDNYVYIVMELCEGGEVKQGHAYSECKAKIIMGHIMRGLFFCHENHVLHLDLKPQNVLFKDRKHLQVKLVDFGGSTFHEKMDYTTRHERMVGTLSYMAPEVLNLNYGRAADAWSAGVMLHEMLTGHVPFKGTTPQEVYDAIHAPDALLRICTPNGREVSEEAIDLILGMLTVEEELRLTPHEILNHPWMRKPCTGFRKGCPCKGL